MWESEYKVRPIISRFLKDKAIGSKRLASMPDRVTNTISTQDEGVVHRPTVINCYAGPPLRSVDAWWAEWKPFMFSREVLLHGALATRRKVFTLLNPITRSKYPAVTEQEEQISLPLQTLVQAIFDAVMVHMMTTIARDTWQGLRATICAALNVRKSPRINRTVCMPDYCV
eukprot:COSAG01_NODE_381_length_17848_cov_10.220338_7_plen_171_part_00